MQISVNIKDNGTATIHVVSHNFDKREYDFLTDLFDTVNRIYPQKEFNENALTVERETQPKPSVNGRD